MTGVVVAVLRTRCTVQVNDHLQPVRPRPADSLIEIVRLTLNVRFPTGDIVRPEPNRYPDMIETGSSDLTEVILGDPGVPVIDQCVVCRVVVLILAEGILVNDTIVTGVGKEARCDEGLEHQPPADIHTADLLRPVWPSNVDASFWYYRVRVRGRCGYGVGEEEGSKGDEYRGEHGRVNAKRRGRKGWERGSAPLCRRGKKVSGMR